MWSCSLLGADAAGPALGSRQSACVLAVLGGSGLLLYLAMWISVLNEPLRSGRPMGPADAQSRYGGRRALAVPDGGMECDRSCNTLSSIKPIGR